MTFLIFGGSSHVARPLDIQIQINQLFNSI